MYELEFFYFYKTTLWTMYFTFCTLIAQKSVKTSKPWFSNSHNLTLNFLPVSISKFCYFSSSAHGKYNSNVKKKFFGDSGWFVLAKPSSGLEFKHEKLTYSENSSPCFTYESESPFQKLFLYRNSVGTCYIVNVDT